MKGIKDFLEECCGVGAPAAAAAGAMGTATTPANTMGMGNPDGTEVPTAKSKVEKVKRRRKPKAQVKESLRFNRKTFLAELATLMDKYKVNIVDDIEGTWLEDAVGHTMILDLTNEFISPERMKEIAIHAR